MKTITGTFNGLLADMLVFRQKVLHYHWTITGHHFFQLHEQFEAYYNQWSQWIDAVAERMLQIDEQPIATLKQALTLATIHEDETVPADVEMVSNLIIDMNAQKQWLVELIAQAEAKDDRPTANLADEINDAISKNVWMLESFVKQQAHAGV